MMNNSYLHHIKISWPLLASGIFMVYLAVADDVIFNLILNNTIQNRITVAAATVTSAALPMFFAVGLIKQSILPNWQTIYQYEQLLEKNIFVIMAIILLITIVVIKLIFEGPYLINIPILVTCVALSSGLALNKFMKKFVENY